MEIVNYVWMSLRTWGTYLYTHPLETLGLVLAYFSLIVPIRQYLNQKKIEEKDKRFTNYHQIIKELVGPDNPFIDRQIALVFELRNYPEYFEVSKRILLGLRDEWSQDGKYIRLVEETSLTISFIGD